MKNVCIIGCGNIARTHSKNLKALANLYFFSRTKESAEKFNLEYEGSGVFENFDDILADNKIDAVFINTPPKVHKDQIINSLNAGKNVIVEKPMCLTLNEMEEIEKHLNKSSSFLMIAENYYYKPVLRLIRNIIDEGHLGDIKSVLLKKQFENKTEDWRSHYGALYEGGIHFVALMSGIIDKDPISINAEYPDHIKGEAERRSILNLTYENNVNGKLIYSWNTPNITKGLFQHSYVIGNKGKITFESNGIYTIVNCKTKKGIFIKDLSDITGFNSMIKDFVNCLDDRSKIPFSDFKKAKRDLMIVFEAYKNI